MWPLKNGFVDLGFVFDIPNWNKWWKHNLMAFGPFLSISFSVCWVRVCLWVCSVFVSFSDSSYHLIGHSGFNQPNNWINKSCWISWYVFKTFSIPNTHSAISNLIYSPSVSSSFSFPSPSSFSFLFFTFIFYLSLLLYCHFLQVHKSVNFKSFNRQPKLASQTTIDQKFAKHFNFKYFEWQIKKKWSN